MSLQIELCGVKILSVCDVAEIVTFNKVQARRYIFKYLSTTADGEEKSSSKKAGTGWMAIEIESFGFIGNSSQWSTIIVFLNFSMWFSF